MSVQLQSIDSEPVVSANICNGDWAAIIACARAYEGDAIPDWNGCHDGQTWTPDQLHIIADRLQQAANLIPVLRELVEAGGVKIT